MRGSIAVAVEISALSRPAHISQGACFGGGACSSTPHVGSLHLNARRQHYVQQSGASKACEASLGSPVKVGHGNGANSRPSNAAEKPLSAAPLSQISLTVVEAASEEELRAAAYLRARTFYTYPDDRSIDGIMAHRRMKAEDDWRALVSKVTGAEESCGRVICLIALANICSFQLSMTSDLQTSCKVGLDTIVVGSLDLNQGLRLPGEISGDLPSGPEAKTQRGYLSNVCVAEEVRRKGVAKALITHAQNTAQQWGICCYICLYSVRKTIFAKQGLSCGMLQVLPTFTCMLCLTICPPRIFTLSLASSTRERKVRQVQDGKADLGDFCSIDPSPEWQHMSVLRLQFGEVEGKRQFTCQFIPTYLIFVTGYGLAIRRRLWQRKFILLTNVQK